MSINHLGTPDTKSYISANVNSVASNSFKVRLNDTFYGAQGVCNWQEYTPSIVKTDTPSDLNIEKFTFLYKTTSTDEELCLSIVFCIDFLMVNITGNERAFEFSLPNNYSTTSITQKTGNAYMVGEFPGNLPLSKVHILKEITNPTTETVRVVLSNPTSSAYGNYNYFVRGEISIRLLQ